MIGILGGTFDPVHHGHLRPALDVMQQCQLDEIRFIPNAVPPHRAPPWLSTEQRLELLTLAIKDYPGFVVDEREIERGGTSYMVETLESLKADFPQQTLCLILGVDAFADFDNWFRAQDIRALAHLIITTRPVDSDVRQHLTTFGAEATIVEHYNRLREHDSGKILIQSVTQLDISSTLIRHCLTRERSVRDFVPEVVCNKLETYAD